MSWTTESGYLDVKSCKGVEKYLLDKTGIKPEVHKTDRYLYITYVKNGLMDSIKIPIPAGVLYCLKEKDFEPVIEQMNRVVQPN